MALRTPGHVTDGRAATSQNRHPETFENVISVRPRDLVGHLPKIFVSWRPITYMRAQARGLLKRSQLCSDAMNAGADIQ